MHWSEVELRRFKKEGFKYSALFQIGGGESRDPLSKSIGFMTLDDFSSLLYVKDIIELYQYAGYKEVFFAIDDFYGDDPVKRINIILPFERGVLCGTSIAGWFCDLENSFNDEHNEKDHC